MTRKIVTVGFVLAMCFLFVSSAMAAEPNLAGSWNVTFYLEPNHTTPNTQCVVFIKDGSQVGESNSGTWTSPSVSGWSGEWFQEGEQIQWYGFTSSGLATSETGSLQTNSKGSAVFNHFISGTTSSAGATVMSRVSSCPAAAPKSSGSDDPAK
jgi:hypothetical protein